MKKNYGQNQQNIINTKTLLTDIIRQPSAFKDNEALLVALKTQGKLAKYLDNERNIYPCSLNTLKSLSNSLLERGFIELDELRINARTAIERVIGGTVKTDAKVTLNQKLALLKQQLALTQQSNFLLTAIIDEMRGQMKSMAEQDSTDEGRVRRYQYANKKIEAQLSYIFDGES